MKTNFEVAQKRGSNSERRSDNSERRSDKGSSFRRARRRERAATNGAREDSNCKNFSRTELLAQLEAENADLRSRAVDIALQIHAFHENN
jgi:hypothetical protein